MTGSVFFKEIDKNNVSEFIKLKQSNFIKNDTHCKGLPLKEYRADKKSKHNNKFISDYEELIKSKGKSGGQQELVEI